jgi:hypothetical protein
MIALNRRVKTWQRHVDAFIALSDFQKNKMVEGGLPAANIHIKPPFYVNPPSPLPWEERESKVVCAAGWDEKGLISFLMHGNNGVEKRLNSR